MESSSPQGHPEFSTSPITSPFIKNLGDGREGEGDSDSDEYAEGEDGLLLDQLRE